MLSLHTNAAALSAQNSISKTQNSLSTSMTRLSTGFRINSAMDDAAGLQIATRLKAQTSGMAMAMRNTQNATSMIQTADGALNETVNILVRMKDLATQGADASATDADKTAMQAEFDTLTAELSNVLGNTSFGGAKLLTTKATAAQQTNAVTAAASAATAATASTTALGSANTSYNSALAANATSTPATVSALALAETALIAAKATDAAAQLAKTTTASYSAAAAASSVDGKMAAALNFQIGSSTSETMGLDLSGQLTAMHSALASASGEYNSFGAPIAGGGAELTAAGGASKTIDKLQAAIDAVGSVRSALGAAGNRLDHVATNLANISTNTQAATGRIMDTDFATESSNMTASQMLLQAGTAMLKQSNSMSSMVMSLLQ